jgi:hypothetical protein
LFRYTSTNASSARCIGASDFVAIDMTTAPSTAAMVRVAN